MQARIVNYTFALIFYAAAMLGAANQAARAAGG